MKHKCQVCGERAVIHVTDIDPANVATQYHFCYRHAQEYLRQNETESNGQTPAAPSEPVSPVESDPSLKCPVCGISFEQFKQIGRLGCPHDYEVFHSPLKPLLENIHGGLRHIGKVPRRLPPDAKRQTELIKLRQEIQHAIAVEDYEKAAALRDQIEAMEKSD
jgi:protein arginine kinase activator